MRRFRVATEEDVGKYVEVSEDGKDWVVRLLIKVISGKFHGKYFCQNAWDNKLTQAWQMARVPDK